jgi:SPX domain protein involved in polyphosphate accumulation
MNRYEVKYCIPPDVRSALEPQVRAHMQLDSHGRAERGRYQVDSLYFDSPDWGAYHEKMAGLFRRKKLRLRFYDNGLEPLVLEVKGRVNNIVIKERLAINESHCNRVLRGLRLYEEEGHPVVQTYNRYATNYEVRPRLLIEYWRKAYVAPLQANLRITFDTHVTVQRRSRLDDAGGVRYPMFYPHLTVLEIKFAHVMPEWVYQLVRRVSLVGQSVSKYCIGVTRLLRAGELAGAEEF